MNLTRRKFLAYSAGAIGYCMQPGEMLNTSMHAQARAAGGEGKTLVVIQLNGGNDALNMVVPYTLGRYFDARPNIAIADSAVIPLTSTTALHPSMIGLANLFAAKQLAVVQSVGYPEASRSHFRSSDIWQTGCPDAIVETGWLGRFIEFSIASHRKIVDPNVTPLAVNVDSAPPKTLQVSRKSVVPFVSHFRSEGGSRDVGSCERIEANLELIANMICESSTSRIFTTSMDGFDTHTDQKQRHGQLLGRLSQALSTFYDRLGVHSKDKDVMTLVFSEFGRQLKENDVRGTDHGSSGTCLVVGGAVNGGVYGDSLHRSKRVDSKFEIDFREVYATILDRWLDADSREILGYRFDHLPFV